MKYSIRIDRTNPSALRVQIVRYLQRKRVVLKHVGTAHTEDELLSLKEVALRWIREHPQQSQLFSTPPSTQGSDILKSFEYRGIRYSFAYEFLRYIFEHFQFAALSSPLLTDLVIMRIFEPTSKLRSLSLLSQYFNIHYSEKVLYQSLRTFPALKQSVEERMVAVAKKEFGFDFSFVLYDVTTLYFETFTSDIPSILEFKSLHKIKTLTIVADAAMLSVNTIQQLIQHDLTYIVGARLGNISADLLYTIDTNLARVDMSTMRTETEHGTLVCGYSKKRYTKDLSDMNKHIKRAESHVKTPGIMKRAKFVSTATGTVSLNEALIAKTRKLLGIKGYYTNLAHVLDADIMAHYHRLWNVEQSFRVAKSDLASRPIFHRKESSIRAHMLICIMALALSKYIEIKTKRSIRSVLDVCRSVTDALLIHRTTDTKTVLRSPIPEEMKKIQEMLSH